jgi:hypothetical protein
MTVTLTLIDDNDGEEQHGALERVEQHPDKAGCQKKLFLNNSSDMTHNRGLPMIHPKITEKGMTKSLQMTPQISHVSQTYISSDPGTYAIWMDDPTATEMERSSLSL